MLDNVAKPTEEQMILSMIMTRHPSYNGAELERYRLTYERTDAFITKYLQKHYEEDPAAWSDRQAITYNPSFAAEAVDEYVRALVQRSSDIHRVGGLLEYIKVCEGEQGGVDRQGSTMTAFMSKYVIPELLAMGRVGVYVDNDILQGKSLADVAGKHPYIYVYRAENILNWRFSPTNPNEITAVLLRDFTEDLSGFGLPWGYKTRYRIVSREKDRVVVRFYDEAGKQTAITSQNTEFPFVMLQLAHSLLKVTSRIQIALLNLCSSDMYNAWAGNFPLYTEQFDAMGWDRLKETRTKTEDLQAPSPIGPLGSGVEFGELPPGPATEEANKIRLGVMHGRRYPMGAERPGFIHPSSEPLKVSMQKEQQLKMEIRQLTALAITQLEPSRQASAEAKAFDNLGLEAGMALIAQELELGENKISGIYHSYDRTKPKATRAKYPQKYNLKSDEDRREEAKQLKELHQSVPSRLFQDYISEQIASTLLRDAIPSEDLDKIYKQIKDSPVPTADPDILKQDHEAGLVGDKTASMGRGYGPTEYLAAQADHAKRTAVIAAAQASARPDSNDSGDPGSRGTKDMSNDPNAAVKEKAESQNGNMDKHGRGPEGASPKEKK